MNMRMRRGQTWPTFARAQRGAVLVISAIALTTIMAFAVYVAGRSSRSALHGAYVASDSLQALLSAESGLMRATKRYSGGTACASIGETITISTITGVSVTTVGKTTDYSGAALTVTGDTGTVTSCRIEATATVTASNISRKVSQIVDTSIFDLVGENGDFAAGAATAATGWRYTDVVGAYIAGGNTVWKSASGYTGTHPACSGAAYMGRNVSAGAAYTYRADNAAFFNHYTSANKTVIFDYQFRYTANPNDAVGNTIQLFAETSNGGGTRYGTSAGTPVVMRENPNTLSPTFTNPPQASPCTTGYRTATAIATTAIPSTDNNPVRAFGYTVVFDAGPNSSPWAKEFNLDISKVSGQALDNGETYTRIRQWRECLPGYNNCP